MKESELDSFLVKEFESVKRYLGNYSTYNVMMDYHLDTHAFLCLPMEFCWKMTKIGRIEQSFLAAFGILS